MRLMMAAWFVATALPLSWMAAKHTAVLRTPEAGRLVAAGPEAGRWRVIHVLVAGCKCSERVARQLEQAAVAGQAVPAQEYWWAGEEPAPAGSRLAWRRMTAVALERETGLTGGPALLIVNGEGAVVYAGGHAPGDVAGRRFVAALQRGERVKPLRVRGCAALVKARL